MASDDRTPLSVLPQFASAMAELGQLDVLGPELLPVRLAMACARVLPVDGAGLSVTSALRVPLGASDTHSATVERLQVTLGEGPCLSADDLKSVVIADEGQIGSRWPAFYDRLVTETPYRSVASIPLETSGQQLGALDLYWVDPYGSESLPLAAATECARHVTAALLGAPEIPSITGGSQPEWLEAPAAQRRLDVWQAVGLLNAASGVDNRDALALLRGLAYSEGTDLDDIAERVVSGDIPVESLAS